MQPKDTSMERQANARMHLLSDEDHLFAFMCLSFAPSFKFVLLLKVCLLVLLLVRSSGSGLRADSFSDGEATDDDVFALPNIGRSRSFESTGASDVTTAVNDESGSIADEIQRKASKNDANEKNSSHLECRYKTNSFVRAEYASKAFKAKVL